MIHPLLNMPIVGTEAIGLLVPFRVIESELFTVTLPETA